MDKIADRIARSVHVSHAGLAGMASSRAWRSHCRRLRMQCHRLAPRIQAPLVQARSSRSRGCAAKHPDGYRDTVYRPGV